MTLDVTLNGARLNAHQSTDLYRSQLPSLDQFSDQPLRNLHLLCGRSVREEGARGRWRVRMALHAFSVLCTTCLVHRTVR